MESALGRAFQKRLQAELDPVWHQLSWKTKQLVADLRTLRTVILYLTQYDSVTFLSFVSALRTTENAVKSGGWMILDAAETLFLTARQRVFGAKDSFKKDAEGKLSEVPPFEECPKWKALTEILEEIRDEGAAAEDEKVLILTSDERTAAQIQDYMAMGGKALLSRLFNKSLGEKYGYLRGLDEKGEAKEQKHKGVGKKSKGEEGEAQKEALPEAESRGGPRFPQNWELKIEISLKSNRFLYVVKTR